jgi:transcriptional regulator GlxA family with amidase domain
MVAWRRTSLGWVLLALAACAPRVAADDGARKQPLVAVVALNDGTEITDFLVPFGTLAAADVADVVAVAGEAGPVQMLPAVRLSIATTLDAFDRDHPGGADYVIVPAVHRSDDARLLAWLRRQAARGATVVGICDGVWVLANAGLLEGHTATGHWYSLPSLRRTFPGVHWVEGRRFVRDGPVMTTTGVTASLPASVALVGMLGGDTAAQHAAGRLGVAGCIHVRAEVADHRHRRRVHGVTRHLVEPLEARLRKRRHPRQVRAQHV